MCLPWLGGIRGLVRLYRRSVSRSLAMADRRSVTRRMCRSSTKEVTCTSPRISKLYMAYEHINEGLPGHHYKSCPQIIKVGVNSRCCRNSLNRRKASGKAGFKQIQEIARPCWRSAPPHRRGGYPRRRSVQGNLVPGQETLRQITLIGLALTAFAISFQTKQI